MWKAKLDDRSAEDRHPQSEYWTKKGHVKVTSG